MNYFAGTIIKRITGDIAANTGTYRYVLPSYPSSILLAVGEGLEENFNRLPSQRVSFKYGIAYRLGKQWEESGNDSIKADFTKIRAKGWYNTGNNLISLRNEDRLPNEDTLVILLAGYENIDDRASLQDFFQLDQAVIWEDCLRKSFTSWVHSWLQAKMNPDDYKSDVNRIADIFKTLYEYSLTDLIQVSSFLARSDLSSVMDGSDAFHYVLQNLDCFGLPSLVGLARRSSNKTLSSYIAPALEFFNYSRFLSARDRDKAIATIERFRVRYGQDEFDADTLGGFATIGQLLDALTGYIQTRSPNNLKQLKTADFVFILNKILGYREVGRRPAAPKVKKLAGLPPEVFLRALWLTLGECKKESRQHGAFLAEEIDRIAFQSTIFKHDCDAEDEDDRAASAKEVAQEFLQLIIGGLDAFLEESIQISVGAEPNPAKLTVASSLCPGDDNDILAYQRSSTSEPSLMFEVVISYKDGTRVKREFRWVIPHHHQSRLLAELFEWVADQYTRSGNAVPVFTLPYMTEIFASRDEEEASRLLLAALRSGNGVMHDLLDLIGSEEHDPVKKSFSNLAVYYQNFIQCFMRDGFFTALDRSYDELRRALTEAYETFLGSSETSVFGALLLKAFMLVPIPAQPQSNWLWDSFLQAAVVTPLHPNLLDMIRHQHSFLCESFCYYTGVALAEAGDKLFAEKRWDHVVDLAKIQWPVFGTLTDRNQNLNTNVRSFGYIHLAGKYEEASSFITSRLLSDYDDSEEDDVTDTELFRESRSSRLIKQVLTDYRKLYAFADDGVSIGIYSCGDIQPVIGGINAYLAGILPERGDRPYSLRLNVFSDSRDDSSVMSLVNAWKNYWQEADASTSKRHYHNCRISVAYQVVAGSNPSAFVEHFHNLLKQTNLDVMIFANFIQSGASRFELLEEDLIGPEDYRKFPVLEKACCRLSGGGTDSHRDRVLSNQRFKLSILHAETMAHMKNGHIDPKKRHAVISCSDYLPWGKVVDAAHATCAWVLCIDPSVDEMLLQRQQVYGTVPREIIGFGTGVGAHGENNYTISTEHFTITDIKNKISVLIAARLGPWEQHICDGVAESIVREATNIAGLSVVKATGPSEYVRDFVAYAMVRKLLPKENHVFCDEIVSLDAFQHWFDNPEDGKRPDLLRLKAKIVDGYFRIEAQIIECKMAQHSEGYLEKARQQVESGLKQLADYFRPREDEMPLGLKDKPDQRFWWMQLHRLIASKGEVRRPEYRETLTALERLSEGYFDIAWDAAVVAFWTDLDNPNLESSPEWSLSIGEQEGTIMVAACGREFIRRVCLDHATGMIFDGTGKICYTASKIQGDTSSIGEARQSGDGKDKDSQSGSPGNEAEKGEAGKTDGGSGTATSSGQGDTQKQIVPVRLPDRILLGSTLSGGRKYYWEFGHPDLPNRHLLVFGASGTGKTYTIQALMSELGKAGQNTLIVDYTSGFTNSQLEETVNSKLNPTQHLVRREPLAINPFRQQSDHVDDEELFDDPATVAQRVSGVFAEVYSFGDQQKSALYSAIRDGITEAGDGFTLGGLIERLEVIKREGGPTASSAASVISKIQPFIDMKPLGREDPESWEKLFNDENSRCHIIQLAGFMKDTARLITEFSLIDLYWYYRANGNKNNPKVIILDEIQNLDHRLESPLGQFLTEGRKFGISLILATQTLSNLDKDQRDRLFQASHKLFFKPADTEIRSFAQILSDLTGELLGDWIHRLSVLKRGECYSVGHALNETNGNLEVNKTFKIKITALDERD